MDSRNDIDYLEVSDSSSLSSESTHSLNESDVHSHYNEEDEVDISLVHNKRLEKRRDRKCICMAFFLFLIAIWLIWSIGLSQMGPVSMTDVDDTLKYFDFNDLYNTSFVPKRPSLVWVNDKRDGIYTYRDPLTNDILLESIEDGRTEIFVESKDLTVFPLNNLSSVDQPPIISYSVWSPSGHQLAYVMKNDLYITDLTNHTRVTLDGSPTVFNGVPDWVYEEEVFGTDHTLWWSPDSTHIAYLRFNETAVPDFHLQLYTLSNNSYPDDVSIKYPKAGAPNPLVSLHIYSLASNTNIMITHNSTSNATMKETDSFEENNQLITDVVWATNSSNHLLFKQTNRIQDIEITYLVSIEKTLNKTTSRSIRTYRPDDGGWVDPAQTMVYIPHMKVRDSTVRYLDIIDDNNGYMHLAVIQFNGKTSTVTWLTSGKWEVIPGSVIVDKERQLLHYISTEQSHLERHLYRINLNNTDPSSTKRCLTCPTEEDHHGYYNTNFSPQNGYYILSYEGPNIPTTIVRKVDDDTFETVLEDNKNLKELLMDYALPRTRMVTVKSGGIDMNAMEILPPHFDVRKKYPVLFHVYGGPGSQLASYRFNLNWNTYLASKQKYIIVTVDGRGTGFKGRKYRVGVKGRLGELETIDQINAARHWSHLDYVDSSRIAVWGWSYGGYMASKIIESNNEIYTAGIAVAPVTDWKYYDSIYTERYMSTPQLNEQGYIHSAVNNMTGFGKSRFLLIHGTGDDNGKSVDVIITELCIDIIQTFSPLSTLSSVGR
ncbi:dipeptidyl peptidase IV N-terminal region-domain-containing protein [Pilobolus umbonatus]|nr:dipeptidyl peptidase IV N-terminal region-domain-containing protein [Pilobolus umbonatus]